MLNLTQYLLTKLNEEAIEIADAAFTNSKMINDESLAEFKAEVNDLLGVLDMMPSTNAPIQDPLASGLLDIPENPTWTFSEGFSLVAAAALRVAKMSSKCIVFGTSERHKNLPLENYERLAGEILVLFTLINALFCKLNDTDYACNESRAKKRNKMARYMDVSYEQCVVDMHTAKEFKEIISKLNNL